MQDHFAIISAQQLQTINETNELVKLLLTVLQNPQTTEQDKKPQYLTRKEAAKVLKITLPTLDKYTESGRLSAHYLGRRVLYDVLELQSSITNVTSRSAGK